MAGGGRHSADASPSKGQASRAGALQSAHTGPVRAIALAAALMLAILAALSLQQTVRQPGQSVAAEQQLTTARMAALRARAEGHIALAQAAVRDGRGDLARDASDPLGVAEAALRTGEPAVLGVAVVDASGILAQAGRAPGADWKGAAAAATGPSWIGAPLRSATSYLYVSAAPTGGVGPRLVVAIDAARLLDGETSPLAAIALPDGRIVAARGSDAVRGAATVREALGVNPGSLDGGSIKGRTPDGQVVRLLSTPLANGQVLVLGGTPAPAGPSAIGRLTLSLLTVLAPVLIGGGLTLLLVWQNRRAQQAHRAFADSEERFRMAVEAARCGIWEWDLKDDRVFLSEVTGAIMGWGGGGVVEGAQVLERISPDHRERVRQALSSAAVYGAFDVSFRVPDRGGRSAWIDARGQGFDPGEGGYTRIIGVALDVTEERVAQARVQAAETRLYDAIESISEAFALWDRAGRLVLCNRNYRSVFSLPPKIIKPGAARDSINRFVQLAIKREAPMPEGSRGPREVELNNGRWLQISERRTADGGIVFSAADITAIKLQDEARKLNEAALQEAVNNLERSQTQLAELARKYEAEKVRAEGANRAKSEFLANMSHELRTPLNAVNGFSEIMVGELFGPLGDARYKEYAQDILNSGQHLLALINDILDMAKIEAGKLSLKFEPMLIEDVTEDAVRLMRNRAESVGLELSMDMPQLPEVEADYRALKQVLLNLLSNAIKFTPRGGRVTVTAAAERSALGEFVRLTVSDTGIGIAPDDLKRLAQPFEQIESQHSKTQQGTGLGLALTKSLIEMHGGSLDMSSEPGQGTAVSVVLPRRQPRAPATDAYVAA